MKSHLITKEFYVWKVQSHGAFIPFFCFYFCKDLWRDVVARIPFLVGKIVGSFLIVVFTIDFLHSLYVEKKEDIPERVWRIKDTLIEKFHVL